jgi:Holliday junction resolvase RusA-like endonuclease
MFIFEIHGNPIPQQQTRFANGHSYDPSKKDKEQIQWQIRHYAPKEPLQCPIQIDMTFYVPIPQSTSGIKKRQMNNQVILPIKKPDIDNLAYLITNAMKAIFYKDDAQVIDMYLHKRYGNEPRTVVKVIPVNRVEQTNGDRCE